MMDDQLGRYFHARDLAGAFIATKFWRQCAEAGIQHAAKNLRKQGAPIGVALALTRASGFRRPHRQ